MQRIKALIDKLNIQFQQNARPAEMLVTLQLLQKEITGGMKETQMLGSSNVSVMIPNAPSINYPKIAAKNIDDEKIYFELREAEASEEEIAELLLQNSRTEKQEKAKQQEPAEINTFKKRTNQTAMQFGDEEANAINEVPTFAQYRKSEASSTQKSAAPTGDKPEPLKQLKKGISELDKQLFLKELFRGDADMYERSIKTIDNFHAYPEAEFWIRRELKTKLGWLPDNPTVDHFDRLVKRRFS